MYKKLKAIILAGGEGTRLLPITKIISKQLLPIFDKPMIFYPLSTLIEANIKDITIITKSRDLELYKQLLGDGSHIGVNLSYKIQDKANGIAESFIICSDFIGNDNVCLILGDNLFHGDEIPKLINLKESESKIFVSRVNDPERYGVLNISKNGSPKKIIEKPTKYISSLAVTGLYCYESSVVEAANSLTPSSRNELEITDINNLYLKRGQLEYELLKESDVWMDSGTYKSLLDASNYVKTFQARQNKLIGSPEISAFKNGWVSSTELAKYVKDNYKNSNYAKKILSLLQDC